MQALSLTYSSHADAAFNVFVRNGLKLFDQTHAKWFLFLCKTPHDKLCWLSAFERERQVVRKYLNSMSRHNQNMFLNLKCLQVRHDRLSGIDLAEYRHKAKQNCSSRSNARSNKKARRILKTLSATPELIDTSASNTPKSSGKHLRRSGSDGRSQQTTAISGHNDSSDVENTRKHFSGDVVTAQSFTKRDGILPFFRRRKTKT